MPSEAELLYKQRLRGVDNVNTDDVRSPVVDEEPAPDRIDEVHAPDVVQQTVMNEEPTVVIGEKHDVSSRRHRRRSHSESKKYRKLRDEIKEVRKDLANLDEHVRQEFRDLRLMITRLLQVSQRSFC